jgi:thioredoxin-related protein
MNKEFSCGTSFKHRICSDPSFSKYAVQYSNTIGDTGATAISYGVRGVPETVFIDRRGIIIRKVAGQLTMQKQHGPLAW